MVITIISSSRRNNRISHRIALALEKAISSLGHSVQLIDLLELNLPPFTEQYSKMVDEDRKLWQVEEQLLQSNGMLFLTPEYNGTISSSLKNFIDVYAKRPFDGKPIGVVTGSTGMLGGIRAAYQLQQIILSIFAYPMPHMLTVGLMDKIISENGEVLDENFRLRMEVYLTSYLSWVEKMSNN